VVLQFLDVTVLFTGLLFSLKEMSQVLAAPGVCFSWPNMLVFGTLTGPMARIQQHWFPSVVVESQEQKKKWDQRQC